MLKDIDCGLKGLHSDQCPLQRSTFNIFSSLLASELLQTPLAYVSNRTMARAEQRQWATSLIPKRESIFMMLVYLENRATMHARECNLCSFLPEFYVHQRIRSNLYCFWLLRWPWIWQYPSVSVCKYFEFMHVVTTLYNTVDVRDKLEILVKYDTQLYGG